MSQAHRYEMDSNWIRDKIVEVRIEGKQDFKVATPLDFWPQAPPGVLSPEDLFVAAIATCYGVSVSGAAQRFHAEFKGFSVRATGTLKEGEFGWEFDTVVLHSRIVVTSQDQKDRMAKASDRAHRYCLVGNSVKCSVHLETEIVLEE